MNHLCISLSLLLAATASSQSSSALLPASLANQRAVATCRDGDDVFGFGPNYLLRATADRITFTPVLGAGAPRSVPLSLRFLAVESGGRRLVANAPARTHDATSVTFDRGVVRERYALRLDGVEQTFVVDQRPAGTGDLVVRLQVECPVDGVPTPVGGWHFHGHGGGIDYGVLLGVDAHGATAAGTVRLAGTELELRLPADFVAAATYPLTFDPLIGTAQLASSTADDGDPAVAWLPLAARWLVVWRRVVAVGESHLLGQIVDGTAGSNPPFVIFSSPGIDVSLPRVAACAAINNFVVAWRTTTGVFATSPTLRLRTVLNDGSALGTQTVLGSVRSLALADSAPGLTTMPMAWIDAAGTVFSQKLQVVNPTSVQSSFQFTLGTVSTADATVAITRHGLLPSRHVVIWSGSTQTPSALVGAVTTGEGTPLGSATTLTGPIQAKNPALDGNGSQFLLTWNDANSVHVQSGLITTAGAEIVPTLTGTTRLLQSGSATMRNGDVAIVGDRYVVSHLEQTSLLDTVSRVQVTDPIGQPVGPAMVLAGPPRAGNYERQGAARLAPRDPLLANDDRVLAVFEEGQTVLPLDRDVVWQELETMGAGGPVTTLAQSCGVGGVCSVNGPCALGNGDFSIRLLGGDPTAPLVLLSLAVQPVLVPCGPCTLLAPDVLETPPITNGFAERPFPIPIHGNLLGASIVAEWLPAFGVPGPCPLLPFVTTSTVVRMEIGL